MRQLPDFESDFMQDPQDTRRKRKQHGMKPAQIEMLLTQQGSRCAICGTTDPGASNWSIDHDHRHCPGQYSCGRCVRGILCRNCNILLGVAKDDPNVLMAAIHYLRRYEEWRPV